jgi:MFS family permease
VIRKRTIWSSSLYAFFLGAAFFITTYYLPIWFQAVKGASAVKSGIMNIPMLLSVTIFSVLAGAVVTTLGYFTPFMIIGSVLGAVGLGITSLFKPESGAGVWIGFQIVAGVGMGLGFQQPMIAVQTVLEMRDVPTGTALAVFSQTLGGSLFSSVAQNVFSNKLVTYTEELAPGLDPQVVLATGATSIQSTIPSEYLQGVTLAYNNALDQTFIVAAAMAGVSFLASSFVEWKSVKGKKLEMAA